MSDLPDLSQLLDQDLAETIVRLERQYLDYLHNLEDGDWDEPNTQYALSDMEQTIELYREEASKRGLIISTIFKGE